MERFCQPYPERSWTYSKNGPQSAEPDILLKILAPSRKLYNPTIYRRN